MAQTHAASIHCWVSRWAKFKQLSWIRMTLKSVTLSLTFCDAAAITTRKIYCFSKLSSPMRASRDNNLFSLHSNPIYVFSGFNVCLVLLLLYCVGLFSPTAIYSWEFVFQAVRSHNNWSTIKSRIVCSSYWALLFRRALLLLFPPFGCLPSLFFYFIFQLTTIYTHTGAFARRWEVFVGGELWFTDAHLSRLCMLCAVLFVWVDGSFFFSRWNSIYHIYYLCEEYTDSDS